MNMNEIVTKQKNITLEDVQNVIAGEENDICLNSTNANQIRKILGRGSLSTVQKFLNILREQNANDNFSEDEKVDFRMSKDSIENIVNTIQASVNVSVLEKLNSLNIDRDRLHDNLNVASNDNIELLAEVEKLEIECAEKDERIDEIAGFFNEREKSYEDEILALNAKLEESHKNNEEMKEMFEKFMHEK